MKVRTGFVSNSSSSSFCICGIYLEDKENQEELYEKAEKNGLYASYGPNSDYSDGFYVGLEIGNMKPDETRTQFEQRATEKIKEVLGEDAKCSFITEGWYDG